jgi:hypothetical protein
MMNVSIGAIEKLHAAAVLPDSENRTGQWAKTLMENGISALAIPLVKALVTTIQP